MAKDEKNRFSNLIQTTTDAFSASSASSDRGALDSDHKMVNHRQSVYRVPLAMVRPDRFQARLLLPLSLREAFYSGQSDWRTSALAWLKLAQDDRLLRTDLDELMVLSSSLHDTGQIKPVTGQLVNENGLDFFHMLTGERRFWATAFQAIDHQIEEPYVLALIDNSPSLEKQIAENMAYKALTPVGKARAAARLVLESNGIVPQAGQSESEYFRQISTVRLSEEHKDLLQRNLQMERTYFGRLMKYFELSEELLEVCDRADMPERVLREIMQADRALWPQAVNYYAAQEGRSYADMAIYLQRAATPTPTRAVRLPEDPATKSSRLLRRAIAGMDDIVQADRAGMVAEAVIFESNKAEAQALIPKLEALILALKKRAL